MATEVYVLPVPGGPCTSVRRFVNAERNAFRCDSFSDFAIGSTAPEAKSFANFSARSGMRPLARSSHASGTSAADIAPKAS